MRVRKVLVSSFVVLLVVGLLPLASPPMLEAAVPGSAQDCPGCLLGATYITDVDNAPAPNPDWDMGGDDPPLICPSDGRAPIEFDIDCPAGQAYPPLCDCDDPQLAIHAWGWTFDHTSVYLLDNRYLGPLQGLEQKWSTTVFALPEDILIEGPNRVRIDLIPHPNNTCAKVAWGQLLCGGGAGNATIVDMQAQPCYRPDHVNVDVVVDVQVNGEGTYTLVADLLNSKSQMVDSKTVSPITVSGPVAVQFPWTDLTEINPQNVPYTVTANLFDDQDVLQSTWTIGFVYDIRCVGAGGAHFCKLSGYVYGRKFWPWPWPIFPLVGATVSGVRVDPPPYTWQTTTKDKGRYWIWLPPGLYNVTASRPDYRSWSSTVQVQVVCPQTYQDFSLGWDFPPMPAPIDWKEYGGEFFRTDRLGFGTGKVYFLGGRSGATTYGDIYAFDPGSGAWADTGADMPTPVSGYGIARLDFGGTDLLCAFGGRDAGGNPTAAVQCYDPAANTVTAKAGLPGSLGQYVPGGVAVVDNGAYILGGLRTSAPPYQIAEAWAYDPATDSYSRVADLPMARGAIATAAVDGKVYAFGGNIYDGARPDPQARAEVFDPGMNMWSLIADLPRASGAGHAWGLDTGSGTLLDGKVVIAGGSQRRGEPSLTLVYDPVSASYDADIPGLNVPRADYAGWFMPGADPQICALGGRSLAPGYGGEDPPYAPLECYHVPLCQSPTDVSFGWDPEAPLPGQEVTFTGTAAGTDPLAYAWDFGDGSTGSGNPVSHTYAAAADYQVALTVSNDCGEVTVTGMVTVAEPPDSPLWIDQMKMTVAPANPGWYTISALVRVYGILPGAVEGASAPDGPTVGPIEGADAWGSWTYPDGTVHPGQALALTDALGRTRFRVKELLLGEYTFCVEGIAKEGYEYKPNWNAAGPCLSIVVGP